MNIAKLMQQAQAMQAKAAQMQQSLAAQEVTGKSGGDAVSVIMTGAGICKRTTINAAALDDKEMLEDLVTAAINDARAQIDAISKSANDEMMSGLQLPAGMKLPF